MKAFQKSILFSLVALASTAPPAFGHFKLLAPESALQESPLGDPQKAAPCGGTSTDAGTPSGKVTSVVGGDKLHIKIQETVFHPGFYRIALAVNSRDELPKDPQAVTTPGPRGPKSVAGTIQYPPIAPVLADGLFMHAAKFDQPQETDVVLPNINCAKCTLQVIEFMAEHGLNKDGDYTYHHCAVLQITANPTKPIDARFPAEKK